MQGAVKYRSYGVANAILTIQQIFAWIMVIGGVFGLFGAANSLGGSANGQFAVLEFVIGVAMILSAFGTIIGGLLLLALVQSARANIHTAEMTWEMLELMRKSATVPTTGSQQGVSIHGGVSLGGVIKSYKGFAIRRDLDGTSVSVSGSIFSGVIEAEKYIDSLPERV